MNFVGRSGFFYLFFYKNFETLLAIAKRILTVIFDPLDNRFVGVSIFTNFTWTLH